MTKMIFVVDDNDTNLSTAREVLKGRYRVMTLPSAEKMFYLLTKVTPDLILLDIEMPTMDGFEALARLKGSQEHAGIPIIFLTSVKDAQVEVRGFEMGVIDFITKPFSGPVLLNRIKTHLDIDNLIRERTSSLQRLQNGIIYVLADMVENRDHDTGGHVERTTSYIEVLISAMLAQGVYAEEIGNMDIESLVSSARLHDIGKISIPDSILNKPGKLTEEEFEIMKTHCAEGVRIIDQIISRTDDIDFLRNTRLFAGYHHERWDGKGYPYGLQGTDIPLLGRIMAIADVYDALVSERPYKKAFTEAQAVGIMMDSAGLQFDPDIANVFYSVREQFLAVRLQSEGDEIK